MKLFMVEGSETEKEDYLVSTVIYKNHDHSSLIKRVQFLERTMWKLQQSHDVCEFLEVEASFELGCYFALFLRYCNRNGDWESNP